MPLEQLFQEAEKAGMPRVRIQVGMYLIAEPQHNRSYIMVQNTDFVYRIRTQHNGLCPFLLEGNCVCKAKTLCEDPQRRKQKM